MKINLILDGHPISGYTNIDPYGYNDKNKVAGDIYNLDELVEDSEALEIIAADVLSFVHLSDVPKIINHWCSKLRRKGKIIISGSDINIISQLCHQQAISLESINQLLYGDNDTKTHLSQISLEYLIQALKSNCLQIMSKRIRGTSISVEAIRP